MTPEFARPFALDRLGAAPVEQTVTATPAECAALAPRLGIPAVTALACRWRLRRAEAGRILAEGALSATLVRECVVTLDEFATSVAEEFRVVFVPAGQESDDPDPETDDEIPYQASAIDLGEAAAEQLALTLDPYPRQPGAALPDIEDTAESPFALLARRAKQA